MKKIFLIPIIFGVFVLIYLLIFFGVFIFNKGKLEQNSNPKTQIPKDEINNNAGSDSNKQYSSPFSPNIGNKNAKVNVIIFFDFDCPFCYQEYFILKDVIKKYSDKGYFEFRQFPIESAHINARNFANASLCANSQDKFIQMFDYIYLDFKNRENINTINSDLYKEYAKSVGLNTLDFNECMDKKLYNNIVNKDIIDGLNFGVEGTPTFFINGEKVEGVMKTEDWDKIFNY
jgi:protein-disulfide isomerase